MYVTFKYETYNKYENGIWTNTPKPPLGYAALYKAGNEKTEKKNYGQREWARYDFNEAGEYEKRSNYRHEWPDGVIYEFDKLVREGFMKPFGMSRGQVQLVPDIIRAYDTEPLAEEMKPKILDNIPRPGFRIVDTVSRYSTSNKLWRILDPYGFELEISTKNMEEIMMNSVIDHGTIMAECSWDFGKNGIGKAHLNLS